MLPAGRQRRLWSEASAPMSVKATSPSKVRRLNGVMFSFMLVRIAPSPSGPSPEMRTSFFPKLTDFVAEFFFFLRIADNDFRAETLCELCRRHAADTKPDYQNFFP